MTRHLALFAAAAAVMAALSCPASAARADPRSETVSIRVSSEGLDLTTAAGADHFLDRLSKAAILACGAPDFSPLMKDARRDLRHCRAVALAGAAARSRWPLVPRRFAARPEARIVLLAER
ncbi:UrcA family protein [Phenylobacterium sp.]|uniref:UrcA family protein n=1 Tax=Phenylobacterium sp. TaxID=1871053 RepID=UPI00356392DB